MTKDIFKSFLVSDSDYDGEFEIPVINSTNERPNKLIPFSKSLTTKNFDCWVHFYEPDYKFIRVWNNPRKYLARLKKFNGVITPDFSLCRDMPLNMQIFHTYMGKALGHWWQSNGLNVIPNVRFADERTYKFSCDGVPKHSIISVGSLGCMKKLQEREFFKRGLEVVTNYLEPSCIVVYGSAPEEIFKCCKESEVEILQFDSEISQVRSNRKKQKGHLEDTPENRKLLENLANDESKYLGTDKWGNSWNAVTLPDGSQLWVRYSNGVITDGGKNKTPVPWNPETGLCSPEKPKQQKKSKSVQNAAHKLYNYYKNPFLS